MGGREAFNSSVIRTPSFSEPVPWAMTFTSVFQSLLHFGVAGKVRGPELVISPPSDWLTSNKIVSFKGRPC